MLLITVTIMVAGCSNPGTASRDRAAASPSPGNSASASRFAVIGSKGPVIGVNLYALSNYPAAQVRADGARTLSYIRNVLHAEAVDIVWDFYAPSRGSDEVNATASSLSPSNVAILTRMAQQDHLLVEYRPLIMIDDSEPWEGYIVPTDPASWFANYYQRELPYLRVAQQYGINEFVAATEMKAMNGNPLWPPFLAALGNIFHGVISYSAYQADYFSPADTLLPIRYLGMDMYEDIHLPPTASASQVTAAWESFFARLPAATLRATAIDETGIAARDGAYTKPSLLGPAGTLNPAIQANWFTAACHTVRKYHLRAVFFWKVDLTDYPISHPAWSLSTFEGKAGAQAISLCASILRG
ncbi:MAG: hypothetical protein ABSB76_07765 [Streptosporangiaceae bacterium]